LGKSKVSVMEYKAIPWKQIQCRRWSIVAIMFRILLFTCEAQEVPPAAEQQLESMMAGEQSEPEDDSYQLQLEHFRKNRVDLNTADETELKELRILNELQIAHLLAYRNLLGPFISMYELQAVPLWDIATIRKLLPFMTISNVTTIPDEIKKRLRGGEHSLLVRISQVKERSVGYFQSGYAGSPQHIFFRYRYVYKNLLQYGCTGDKDAGEQIFKGAQRLGFDFYSLHVFVRQIGSIHSLAIGDYTVNMGQGLIQWQSLAFKKNGEIMNIKRQSPVLRPYNSGGEFYFHRGVGITIRKRKIETTVFVSSRKLDANIVLDTINQKYYASSILSAGYHRTENERMDRNAIVQTAFGGNINYRGKGWQVGINSVYYRFSLPLQKRNEPYNLYTIGGRNWCNESIDYSYTFRNIHFFGEAAIDKNFNRAFINGVLISADPRVDLSFVQRSIEPAYQAISGNAFTENTYPTNESGFYTGVVIRPGAGLRVDTYADVFKFPWLRFQADAPGNGTEMLIQFTYTPNRQIELYTKFRNERKPLNGRDDENNTSNPELCRRQTWQIHYSYQINRFTSLRSRTDIIWFRHGVRDTETGFLIYLDMVHKPLGKKYSGAVRLQYFETSGYDSRIYAYENDVLYSNSIPAFYQKGYRYYVSINYDLNKKLSCWLRAAQIIYRDLNEIGSGLDAIAGNKKTEIKFQLRYTF
jgi:DNA uptake protein ComE-like DNA-binding protein